MKSLVCFLLLLAITGDVVSGDRVEKEYKTMFDNFVTEHRKTYDNYGEYTKRYLIFKDNARKVDNHNAANHSWSMRLNEFADLTSNEFSTMYIGKTRAKSRNSYLNSYRNSYSYDCDDMGFCYNRYLYDTSGLPNTWDWSHQGVVTPIKNQGQCGSCWAFSTTGALEGAYAIANKKLYSLSEQELVDCSGSFGNEGCQGGLMDDAFMFVKQDGICKESAYPYEAENERCNKTCTPVFKISGYTDVPTSNEDALQIAVHTQPVSVAIEADHTSFQFYSRGVFNLANCGYQLDHGVLVVGWGVEGGLKYWKVKNSWGPSWGDHGYILLARDTKDSRGQCGIAMQPSYPNM